MKVTTRIFIFGSFEKVYGLAEDAVRWPEMMPHFKYVNLLDEYGNKKVLEIAAYAGLRNKSGDEGAERLVVPVKWTVIQESIPEERTISFIHIKGPMKDLEVEWNFGVADYKKDKSIVEVCGNYKFNKCLLVAKYALGNFLLQDPLDNTLKCLKEIVETDTPSLLKGRPAVDQALQGNEKGVYEINPTSLYAGS